MSNIMYELPFRWNLRQRGSLGTLLEGPRPETYPDFLYDVIACCARIVAFCDNADLCFVGRSPESLFDYLSGLLIDTSWALRLQLLHFSWRWEPEILASELAGLRSYFEHIELDPRHLALRDRPVAFIDLVAGGETFGNLIRFLYDWTSEIGEDWEKVKRKIRIVGITMRTKTSPKTWRWQQHAQWVKLLPQRAIKNVSIPERMWLYLGNEQAKVTESYTHWRWGSREAALPDYDEKHLQALRLAAWLFDQGRQKEWRHRFARHLSNEQAMIYPWFRALVLELKL